MRIEYLYEGIVQASYIKCVIFVHSEAVKVNMSVLVYCSRNVKFNKGYGFSVHCRYYSTRYNQRYKFVAL